MRYRRVSRLFVLLVLAWPFTLGQAEQALSAPAPDSAIRVELNAAETVQSRCRLSFLIENKSANTLDSLRLDLAVFDREGVIHRRLVTEMGPVLREKTVLKAFEIDAACAQIGSVLVNDVTACSPGDPGSCLDRMALASKVQSVRLYK
jgi:hypothetical protein